MPARVNGFSLAYTAVGAVVMWSGIKGETISDTFRGLLSGKPPSDNEQPIGTPSLSISQPSSTTGTAPTGGYDIAEDIPAGKNSYSESQLRTLWTDNGGPSDTAAFAAQVAEAESSGSATVTSSNPDGGTNVGIWQLDTKGVGSGYTIAELQDANLNCQLTIMATNGGLDWAEWSDPTVDALPDHQYTPGAA
jgi:hypothetical protein